MWKFDGAKVAGVPKRVLLFEKSPKLDYMADLQIYSFGKKIKGQIVFRGIANFVISFEINTFSSV